MTAATATGTAFGSLLRDWRQRRRLTQLDLGLAADVSARHLSFLETGRSRPSREMVLLLADELDVPLRGRNELMIAAGFAPAYSQHGLDDAELGEVQRSLRRILDGHEPYPAVLVDGGWNLLAGNRAVQLLTDLVGARAADPAGERAAGQPAPARAGPARRRPAGVRGARGLAGAPAGRAGRHHRAARAARRARRLLPRRRAGPDRAAAGPDRAAAAAAPPGPGADPVLHGRGARRAAGRDAGRDRHRELLPGRRRDGATTCARDSDNPPVDAAPSGTMGRAAGGGGRHAAAQGDPATNGPGAGAR